MIGGWNINISFVAQFSVKNVGRYHNSLGADSIKLTSVIRCVTLYFGNYSHTSYYTYLSFFLSLSVSSCLSLSLSFSLSPCLCFFLSLYPLRPSPLKLSLSLCFFLSLLLFDLSFSLSQLQCLCHLPTIKCVS